VSDNLARIAEMQLEGKLEALEQADADALIEIANKADVHDSEMPFYLVLALGVFSGATITVVAGVVAL
jgi:hypothetical protein